MVATHLLQAAFSPVLHYYPSFEIWGFNTLPFPPCKSFLLQFELIISCLTSLGMENKLFLFYRSKMLFSCPILVFCWFTFVPGFPCKWGLLASFQMLFCLDVQCPDLNADVSSRPHLVGFAAALTRWIDCSFVGFLLQGYWSLDASSEPRARLPQQSIPPRCSSHPVYDCPLLSNHSILLLLLLENHLPWTVFPFWHFEFSSHPVVLAVSQAW